MSEAPKELDAVSTFTPVRSDAEKLVLRADYFESPIDLEELQKTCTPTQALNADPLMLDMPGGAHVVVFRFGAVVFWKCSDETCAQVLQKIQKLPDMRPPPEALRDKLVVLVGQAEDRVNFKDVWLKALTLEHIKVLSGTFAQSVALAQCERAVAEALANTGPIVAALKSRGGLIQSAKDLLKTVGFTLAIRETILARLTLFDDPPEAWRSERLAQLHHLLHDHFDIRKRVAGIQEKLTFLSDMNTVLMEVLQNRDSHRLEWIVILLIVVEVILSVVHLVAAGR